MEDGERGPGSALHQHLQTVFLQLAALQNQHQAEEDTIAAGLLDNSAEVDRDQDGAARVRNVERPT